LGLCPSSRVEFVGKFVVKLTTMQLSKIIESMDRILLAVDDYSELVYLQTLLKKVGFDVHGIQHTRNFEEVRLTFIPDLVVASAKGKNVNGLALMEKMKRRGGKPKSVLIIPKALAEKLKVLKLKNVEATVQSPVDPESFLQTLAELLEKDPVGLLEKYERVKQKLDPDNDNDVHMLRSTYDRDQFMAGESREEEQANSVLESAAEEPGSEEPTVPSEFSKATSITPEERQKRMQKWLLFMEEPEHDGFPRDVVKLENKRLRQQENEDGLHDLEEERRAFVRSMFKKKGS
jgi:DNA-binding response OmpR family regulator